MRGIILAGLAAMAILSCGRPKAERFSAGELEILNSADSIMRVLTVEDSVDYAVLRAISCDFSADELMSDPQLRVSDLAPDDFSASPLTLHLWQAPIFSRGRTFSARCLHTLSLLKTLCPTPLLP